MWVIILQMAFLETFWDADVPRFGDSAANGLAQWLALKQMGNQALPYAQSHALSEPLTEALAAVLFKTQEMAANDTSEAQVARKWAAVESWRDEHHWEVGLVYLFSHK
jgi:hypothetical protein